MDAKSLDAGGLVTFWSLSEYSHLALIQKGFNELGIGEFAPAAPQPSLAIRHALGKVFDGPEYLVRSLKKRGLCVTKEQRGDQHSGNDYSVVCTVVLETDGTLTINGGCSPETRADIFAAFEKQRTLITGHQLGAILAKIATDYYGGTVLRPSGGIYWMPGRLQDKWQNLAQTVELATAEKASSVYILRHQLDAQSIRAIHDAVVTELATEADRMRAEIDSASLGITALDSRRVHLESLMRKAADYEKVLGVGLDSIRGNLTELQTSAATAAMLAAAASCGMDMSSLALSK